MTFEMLKYFVETVNTGSANKAARKLYISQPAVSGALKRLEEELGYELFERQKRGSTLILSEKGKMVYEDALQILSCEQKWRNAVFENKEIAGNIHIAVIPSVYFYGLNKFAMDLHDQFPKLNIFLHEEHVHRLLKRLDSRGVNIVVGSYLKTEQNYFNYYVKKNNLNLQELFDDEFYLYINANNPLAKNTFISRKDLKKLKVAVYVDDDDSTVSAFYSELFEKENCYYWSNSDRIIDAVVHEEIVTVNAKALSLHNTYVQNGQIVLKKMENFYVPHTYYILSHDSKELEPATLLVIDALKTFLRQAFHDLI